MARQEINLGTAPTGAGGDTTRSTGVKINSMTLEIYGQGYFRNNSVGVVSQSAGVPTGALMESGSNSNGDYFKFACGALICIKRNFNISGFVIAPGTLGGSPLYPFPAAFVDVPAKSFSGYVSDGVGSRTGIPLIDDAPMNGGSVDGWRFHIKNTSATNTQNVYSAHLTAIGRWF